jgi:hypothetical protein
MPITSETPVSFYPSDIGIDKYAHRKMTITVKESISSETANSAKKFALEKIEQSRDLIKTAVTTVGSLVGITKLNDGTKEGNTIHTIVLPLPNSLSDSQNHNWSMDTGIIGTAGKALTDKDIGFKSFSTGMSADKILGAATSTMGFRKPLIDPGFFQNYSGSEPREFSMQFDLVPNNPEEAESIMMIILRLKQYSAPVSTISGVSLLAPRWFDIEFSNKEISSMLQLGRVVLKNISIDYSGDGSMQQTSDGMPKHITLSLQFAEVDMKIAQDYDHTPIGISK